MLESESAALAAKRITPELADLLFKICDRMAELHEAPASEQLAADTEFHYTIAEASGSPRLHALVRQVSRHPRGIPVGHRLHAAPTWSEAERQHRGIAGGDPAGRPRDEARRLMRSHVEWAGRLAVDRLQPHLARPGAVIQRPVRDRAGRPAGGREQMTSAPRSPPSGDWGAAGCPVGGHRAGPARLPGRRAGTRRGGDRPPARHRQEQRAPPADHAGRQGLCPAGPETKSYRLGLRLHELGALVASRNQLRDHALPLLEALRDADR